jgi:hypothetical protein
MNKKSDDFRIPRNVDPDSIDGGTDTSHMEYWGDEGPSLPSPSESPSGSNTLDEILYKVGTDINKVYSSDPFNGWCTLHYFKLIEGKCVGCEAVSKLQLLFSAEVEKATKDAYYLLYWKYKELNGQSVDVKFAEAYGILTEELTPPAQEGQDNE